MAGFKFPLQTVMDYRKTLENLAQRDFQEALGELYQAKGKLTDMFDQKTQAREQAFQTQIAGGTSGPALNQVDEFMKGQDLRIDLQQAKIQEIEKRVEKLQEILRAKAIDYKIIEKLKERQKELFRIEKNKHEQKQTDEINVMRFRREENE